VDPGLKGDTAQGDAIFYTANFFLVKFILETLLLPALYGIKEVR